jgi:hypothetical protein
VTPTAGIQKPFVHLLYRRRQRHLPGLAVEVVALDDVNAMVFPARCFPWVTR